MAIKSIDYYLLKYEDQLQQFTRKFLDRKDYTTWGYLFYDRGWRFVEENADQGPPSKDFILTKVGRLANLDLNPLRSTDKILNILLQLESFVSIGKEEQKTLLPEYRRI